MTSTKSAAAITKYATVKLIRAKVKDAAFVLKVRNQLSARQASFYSSKITQTEHGKWFLRVLKDSDSALFIITKDKQSVGTLRLKKLPDANAEIHIALLENTHGKGLGGGAIKAALDWLKRHSGWGTKLVWAHIRPDNIASVKCFERSGFKACGVTQINGQRSLRYLFRFLTLLTVIDAGRVSGLGHLMRQRVLATELTGRGHRVTFAVRHLPGDRNTLKTLLPSGKDSDIHLETNESKINRGIKLGQWDALIWDALDFSTLSWSKAARKSKVPIFAVGNYPKVPGWVSHCINPYAPTYILKEKTKLQSSTTYCILSHEFQQARLGMGPRRFPSFEKSQLLIVPGGGNTEGMVFKITEALKDLPSFVKVVIVSGAFFTDIRKLEQHVGNLKCKVKLLSRISPTEMVKLMLKSDLALVSYGRSIDEARALGLPTLVLSSSKLNAQGALHAQKQGGVRYLGDFRDITASELGESIVSWLRSPAKRQKLSHAGMRAVDGFGRCRTADWIEAELRIPENLVTG